MRRKISAAAADGHDELPSGADNVLYDVIVYNEWREEEQQEDDARRREQSSRARSGWRWAPPWGAPNSDASPEARLDELRRLGLSWKLAVTSDAALVAVAQDAVLEVLASVPSASGAGPGYVAVARAELPADEPRPELRRLVWSPDGRFLALTASNGRVFVYDASGDLAFALLSNHLPAWDAPSDPAASYCLVQFVLTPHLAEWHSQLVLVSNSGSVSTFLCSSTGYQELASSTCLAESYPSGLADAVFVPSSSLLYVCGKATGASARGITCWRLLEEEPFLDLVDVQGYETKPSGMLSLFSGGSKNEDPAYCLAVSEGSRFLASAHLASGNICVFSLPGLKLLNILEMADQGCHDDVNPHCLRKDSRSIFLKHPLRFHPTTLRWWDDSSLAIVRLSGGLTLVPTSSDEDGAHTNLLGDSAEFFAPSCVVSQSFEFGFFALEVDGERRFREDANGQDRAAGAWEYVMDLADSIMGGGGGKAREEEEEELRRTDPVTYRLLYFQSTSPEELFQKKIDDEDYGEAVILARHFGLDCDRVFVRQWRASDLSAVAAEDYLSKVGDARTVLRECAGTVPPNADDCRALLTFGLATAAQMDAEDPQAEAARRCLERFLGRLDLYLATLEHEEDFRAQEYSSFRTLPLKETALNLAQRGKLARLKRLLASSEGKDLSLHASEILSSLPEPLDPMPELAEILASPCVTTPPSWYSERAASMVTHSGQSDYAMALLHLAANVASGEAKTDPVFYHHVATFDALVFERKNLGVQFEQVCKMDNKKLLTVLLHKPKSTLARVFKTLGLPFLDRVEQCHSGGSVSFFREFVVELASRDFIAASDLLRVVAENLDETWFTPADLRSMGMDIVWNSSPNSDVQGLATFLDYLKKYCNLEQEKGEAMGEYMALLEAVKTLWVVAKYDPSATIAGVKEAQTGGDGEKAKALIRRILSSSQDKLKSKPQFRVEVLDDVLAVSTTCLKLDAREAFASYCAALLELGEISAIEMAKDIMSTKPGRRDSLGSLGSNPITREVRRVMANFGLGPPSAAEMAKLAGDAATAYIEVSKHCTDERLSLSRACLDATPVAAHDNTLKGLGSFLSALDILTSLFEFVSPLKPVTLQKAKTAEDLGQILHGHLQWPRGTFGKEQRKSLEDFIIAISTALELKKADVKAEVLSAVARVGLECGETDTCLRLCRDLVEGKLERGWRICQDLAEAVGEGGDARLRTFSAAFCDERLEAAARKLESARRLPVVRDVVPGFTFGENALEGWDSAAQARKLADIFGEADAYAKGARQQPGSQYVFEQDPSFSAALVDVGAELDLKEDKEYESLELLRLAMAESMHKVTPGCGRALTASMSVDQLCRVNLAAGSIMKVLTERYKTGEVAIMPPSPEKEEPEEERRAVSEDRKEEEPDEEVVETAECEKQENEPVAAPLPEVCQTLSAMRDEGVPPGLRTMAACLVRLSKRN